MFSFGGAWLVVAVGVDGEFAEEFAGDGVDDADLEVLDEQDDVGSFVGSADADVLNQNIRGRAREADEAPLRLHLSTVRG